MTDPMKPLRCVGSARKDYAEFPARVQEKSGFSLFLLQTGQFAPGAKLLRGFDGKVVEIIEAFDSDAFRVVCSVRFERAIYVLHAFKKKSKSGIATARHDIDLIMRRLKVAEADYAAYFKGGGP
jgi:phage-related protein